MADANLTRPDIAEIIDKVKAAQSGQNVPGVYILNSQPVKNQVKGNEENTTAGGSLFTVAALGALALFAFKPGTKK